MNALIRQEADMKRFFTILLALFVLAGCVAEDITKSPSVAPSSQPHVALSTAVLAGSPTLTSTLPPTTSTPPPTSTTTSTPYPTSSVPLSKEGPWFIFTAATEENGIPFLWALNPDGSGPFLLVDEWVTQFDVRPVRNPDGSVLIAYMTQLGRRPENLTLKTLTLPGKETKMITPLTSETTTYSDQDPNDDESNYWTVIDIALAIGYPDSMIWSPDGEWLAFVAALDGPTADVYSYEAETGTVRHLTIEPDHAYQLLWTPDSRYILHTERPFFEGSGGRYEDTTGIWMAAPDGSEVTQLEGSGAADFIGWEDPTTLVVYSGSGMGFEHNLRQINIRTGEKTDIGPSCFASLAYTPKYDVFLVAMSEFVLDACASVGEPYTQEGLYLITPYGSQYVTDRIYPYLYWSDNVFVAENSRGKQVFISPTGSIFETKPTQISPTTTDHREPVIPSRLYPDSPFWEPNYTWTP